VNSGTIVVVVGVVVVALIVVLVAPALDDTERLAWLLSFRAAPELHPATSAAMASMRHLHLGG
jgi:hypothetical protein